MHAALKRREEAVTQLGGFREKSQCGRRFIKKQQQARLSAVGRATVTWGRSLRLGVSLKRWVCDGRARNRRHVEKQQHARLWSLRVSRRFSMQRNAAGTAGGWLTRERTHACSILTHGSLPHPPTAACSRMQHTHPRQPTALTHGSILTHGGFDADKGGRGTTQQLAALRTCCTSASFSASICSSVRNSSPCGTFDTRAARRSLATANSACTTALVRSPLASKEMALMMSPSDGLWDQGASVTTAMTVMTVATVTTVISSRGPIKEVARGALWLLQLGETVAS